MIFLERKTILEVFFDSHAQKVKEEKDLTGDFAKKKDIYKYKIWGTTQNQR